jgi:predicted ATPase/transcriptional regulator with XRE-family HTH domain
MTTAVPADRRNAFAEMLRRHRLAAGATQEELAEQAELSVRGLRYLERGLRQPNRDTVRRLTAALALPPGERDALQRAARVRDVATQGVAPRLLGAVRLAPGPLIGRDRDVVSVVDLLGRQDVRVLTLTGTGGVGKTRLALEVAAAVGPTFLDGVFWVPLGAVTEPGSVSGAIAAAIGVTGSPRERRLEALVSAVADRRILFLLDDFERVTAAAPEVTDLVARCPALKVLITSRVGLRLRSGHEFVVLPLEIPQPGDPVSVQALATNPAVDLFLRRAQAAKAGFTLTMGDAAAVAAICRSLEGVPLALELAAARVPVLPPHAILTRLEHRLAFLTGGAPDAPPRQRTMRETVAWSHDLLQPPARRLFRRLATFEGGGSLPAIEAVCADAADSDTDLLDALQDLHRNSLLQLDEPDDDEPRFRMFETIREYATEQLHDSGEADEVASRHAEHYLSLAEEAAQAAQSPAAASWLARLEHEHDNLRAVLRRCLARRDGDTGIRLAAALWWFWYVRGHAGEGRLWIGKMLPLPGAGRSPARRATALLGAGQLAIALGNYGDARDRLDESVELLRAADDHRGLAEALLVAGFAARVQEDYRAADARLHEALALARSTGHAFIEAAALHHLGMSAADARADLSNSRRLLEQSLTLYRGLDLPRFVALVLLSIGDVARSDGDLPDAHRLVRESVEMLSRTGERLGIHGVLDSIAHLRFSQGDLPGAIRLSAAADRLRSVTGTHSWPVVERRRAEWLRMAETALDPSVFRAAWSAGQAMTQEQAVTLARDGEPTDDQTPIRRPPA